LALIPQCHAESPGIPDCATIVREIGNYAGSRLVADRNDSPDPESATDDERWLVIDGRRWRRTDPGLAADVVTALKSHLGKARSAVRVAKKAEDDEAIAAARKRVGLAKHGLGERGPYWWDQPLATRIDSAERAVRHLDELEKLGAPKG